MNRRLFLSGTIGAAMAAQQRTTDPNARVGVMSNAAVAYKGRVVGRMTNAPIYCVDLENIHWGA